MAPEPSAVWRHPSRALAACILISGVLAPATLFLFLRTLGSLDSALTAHSILWGTLLAAALLRHHDLLRARPAWGSSWRDLAMVAGAAILVALPLFLNRDLRLRSDAWTHIALVREILQRSFPWTDPRFAGEPLRYFWFFNLWAAGFSARGGMAPPEALALVNLAGLLAYAASILAVAQRFFPSGKHRAAALFVSFAGLNPFGLPAFLLTLASALFGKSHGPALLASVTAKERFLSGEIFETLTPYGTYAVGWIDKYLVATAFGLAMAASVFLGLLIWEAARRGRMSRESLLLIALAYAALLLHHLFAAAFVGVVLGGAPFVARLAGRSTLSWRDLLRFLGVLAAVTLMTSPYWTGIVLGGDTGGGDAYGVGFEGLWALTTLTAVGALCLLLVLGWGRLALALRGGRYAFAVFLALSLALMLFFRMPTVNENKMIILFFCMAAPFGAAGALRIHRRFEGKAATRTTWYVMIACACAVPVLIWIGTLAQSEPPIPSGVASACAWLRHETPRDAVLIEPPGRRVLLNLAERDMFVSEFIFVLQCGYPRKEMGNRIELVQRIYERGEIDPEQAASLMELGRPVYVFYEDIARAGHRVPGPSPTQFEPVFSEGNTAVYRWRGERPQPDGLSR